MHVLLIEQEKLDKAVSLRASLEQDGHQVCLAHTLTGAVDKALEHWPNLVILNHAFNLNLPSLKEAIDKTDLDIPYIVVGRGGHLDKIPGNDIAFVNINDLSHSIAQATDNQKERFFRLPDVTVDCHKRLILRQGKRHTLTPKEFKLLNLFLHYKDQVIKRKTIMQEVWETDYMGDTRTLDVHIRWIREKLEENPSKPRYLITVRGTGYRLITKPV